MLTAPPFPRHNNLDLLRLLFASQVVVMHSGEHLTMRVPPWVSAFPGVPAFFFVSGLLIYASYKSSPSSYWANRFLRLFPGLFAVTAGGVVVVLIAKGAGDLLASPGIYATWFVAQVTLGQAFNPAHFRNVGVGVVNGALWTITVEILFYLIVPVLVRLERRIPHVTIAAGAASFAFYAVGPGLLSGQILHGKQLIDYFFLTPVYWGWVFVLGIETNRHWTRLARYLPWLWATAVPLAALHLTGSGPLFNGTGQQVGLAFMLCYAAFILFLGFATPYVPMRVDVSYGVYIWHMPIINLLLVLGIGSAPIAIMLVAAMALLSWHLIERPALRLKSRSIKNSPTVSEREPGPIGLQPSSPPLSIPSTAEEHP
jgi:peptidoglycan/LPS O-acetylase OafA/YrhL